MTAGQAPGYCLSSTMRKAHVNSVMSFCQFSSWRRAASRSGIVWSRSTCQARYRDGVGNRDGQFAVQQPLKRLPERQVGKLLETGLGELPRGARRYGVVYPRRRLAAGIRSGVRMLRQVMGSSDTPETRVLPGGILAELEERRGGWPD
jgi:hypothetical protein